MNAPEKIEQRSDDWFAARLGHVTGSKVADVLAKIKTGEAAARRDYRLQLVCERLTGRPAEDVFTNAAMQWGTETEPAARMAYEVKTGAFVDEVGFIKHHRIPFFGASPDGLVMTRGLVEIKCPKTATHLSYLEDGVLPARYRPQVMAQLACTGREWCDFVSFDPRLPDDLQLLIVRVQRDDAYIAEMEAEVARFLAEVEETIERLRKK